MLSATDRAVAALAHGDHTVGPLPDQIDADNQEVIILGVLRGQPELVVDALGPNFFGHVGGAPAGTLLHHAAWVGDLQIITRLLQRGADPVADSGAEFDTPVAWAALGSEHYTLPGRDYVAVVEALVAAGAELEERFADVPQGPLADWLDRVAAT